MTALGHMTHQNHPSRADPSCAMPVMAIKTGCFCLASTQALPKSRSSWHIRRTHNAQIAIARAHATVHRTPSRGFLHCGLSDACRSVRVATSVIARHPTILNISGKFLSSSSCVFRAAPGIISPPNAKLTSSAGRLLGRALILPNYNARWYAEKNSSAE